MRSAPFIYSLVPSNGVLHRSLSIACPAPEAGTRPAMGTVTPVVLLFFSVGSDKLEDLNKLGSVCQLVLLTVLEMNL